MIYDYRETLEEAYGIVPYGEEIHSGDEGACHA